MEFAPGPAFFGAGSSLRASSSCAEEYRLAVHHGILGRSGNFGVLAGEPEKLGACLGSGDY